MTADWQRQERPSSAVLAPLSAGTLVRLACVGDQWLSRFCGLYGRVVRSDGLVVEVLLSDDQVVSLWRSEVEVLRTAAGSAHDRTACINQPLVGDKSVQGFTLQAERQRAGLTQREIATAMAVTVQRISQIEAQLAVRPRTAARYVHAIGVAVERRVA